MIANGLMKTKMALETTALVTLGTNVQELQVLKTEKVAMGVHRRSLTQMEMEYRIQMTTVAQHRQEQLSTRMVVN